MGFPRKNCHEIGCVAPGSRQKRWGKSSEIEAFPAHGAARGFSKVPTIVETGRRTTELETSSAEPCIFEGL